MQRNLVLLVIASATLWTIPTRSADQQLSGVHKKRPRYTLTDLGTFGGPNSTDVSSPIMNNRGGITGGAETADPDPNAPNCYAPDCFVMHAYLWKSGVLTDLNGLPGNSGSEGNWINDEGSVAGQSLNGLIDPLLDTPEGIAVLWKRNGQIVDLGTFGGNESLAAMLNNKGQIVGAAANTTPDTFPGPLGFWGTQSRAFLWENGIKQDLGDLGGPDAFANWINERGQIAGVSYTGSVPSPVRTQCGENVPPQNPFLWEKGRILNLGTLGGICSFTSGLNNKGQVVGQSDLAGDITAHPFIWDPKERPHLRDIGTLGGTFGFATSVNDSGQVAGAATTTADQALHAFLWEGGRMADLGTVKGDGCSVAYRVNANAQVVGASGDRCQEVHAFLWQPGGPMMDLNDLIPRQSGLVLTAGEFINDRGEIAASGVLPNGDHHAILLVPCDDATWKDGCGRDDVDSEDAAVVLLRNSPAPPTLSRDTLLAQSHARLLRQYRRLAPKVPVSK